MDRYFKSYKQWVDKGPGRKNALRVTLICLLAGTIAVPAVVVVTSGTAVSSASWTAIRLAGLYAYTLLFWNIVTGSMSRYSYRLFPAKALQKFHIGTGLAGFTLAAIHGITVLVNGWFRGYEAVWVIGPVALGLLALTVYAGLDRRRIPRAWRRIHQLNYVIFVAIFLKVVVIGFDFESSGVPSSALRTIFTSYLAVASIAVFLRARFTLKAEKERA